MKKALVWPPLQAGEYGGTASAASYFSWFFGDVMDQIVLPIATEPHQSGENPYSLGSLANLHKVDIRRDIDAALLQGVTHILMRSKTPQPLPGLDRVKKMTGSEKVEIADGPATGPLYFYIGTPEDDKQDAYFCVLFTYWLEGGRNEAFLAQSQQLLMATKAKLLPGQPISVFGTGPSIAEVNPRDHRFGVSMICNTIVKNRDFCKALNLAVIIASDCHFHFSCSQYSFQFLSDLRHQIATTEAIYITFDKFAPFVMKKVPELAGRTCGIPAGRDTFGYDLDRDFRVLPGESVVNMFMLPVACFLSQDVRLCGFTGRAPSDNYFWSHADAFQYQDLLPTVRQTHPGFFKNRDYDAYSDLVGQQLSSRALAARENGLTVRSLTTSFYKGLENFGAPK